MTKRRTSKRVPRGTSKRVPLGKPDDLALNLGAPHLRARPDPLFAPPPLIVETVHFSRIGHTFKKIVWPGWPTLYAVQDFLLDQTGASGADGKVAAFKAFDLTTAVSYRYNVWHKDRSKIITVVPPPSGPVFFSFDVGRRFVNAVSDYSDIYPANSFFVNLSGQAPVFTYNNFFIGHNTNHWTHFWVMADIVDAMKFSAFTTIGVYPPRSFDPGLKTYIPYANSLPVGLPGPNGVPHLMFSYLTEDPVDPGLFVTVG